MHKPDFNRIVRAAIYPAIGIARVGNSAAGYYIGPELTHPSAPEVGAHRDHAGALKRQAARFRIYGYDGTGTVIAELTAADAEMAWTVEVANLKAAWYQFQIALDLPEAATAEASVRRNAGVADRTALAIQGGVRRIEGPSRSGHRYVFDGGHFQGIPVTLGELRTDKAGRLLVLGGHGISASVHHAAPTTYANNEGWYDDVSDGPVTATLTIGGRAIPVEPAWVVTAPPDYAPNLKSVRTMFDLLTDLYIGAGWISPRPVTFTEDIQPILERMSGLQWTNAGFAAAFGHGSRLDFGLPSTLASFAAPLPPDDPGHEARRQFANAFRVIERDGSAPSPMPWLYGDAVTGLRPLPTHEYAALTDTQLAALQAWARGTYTPGEPAGIYAALEAVPLAAQPAMLDRAALDFCLADAFHPGCELTWPMRHLSLYSAPYRIRHAAPSPGIPISAPATVRDAGTTLTPTAALAPDGRAMADRYRQLPLGLSPRIRSFPAHVLAGPGAQPGAGLARLPGRDRHGPAPRRPLRRLPDAPVLARYPARCHPGGPGGQHGDPVWRHGDRRSHAWRPGRPRLTGDDASHPPARLSECGGRRYRTAGARCRAPCTVTGWQLHGPLPAAPSSPALSWFMRS